MQGTVVFQNWEISTFSLEAACTRPLLQRGPSHMAQGSPVKMAMIASSIWKLGKMFSHLLLWFHLLCLHLLHLTGEHSLRLCGRVDAVRLWTEEGLPIEKFWQHSVYQNKKFIGSDQS